MAGDSKRSPSDCPTESNAEVSTVLDYYYSSDTELSLLHPSWNQMVFSHHYSGRRFRIHNIAAVTTQWLV